MMLSKPATLASTLADSSVRDYNSAYGWVRNQIKPTPEALLNANIYVLLELWSLLADTPEQMPSRTGM
ncbi:hypothetical protein DL768_007730 [Monosporascus sp. mg162]|nr:hypothetical protein DL768_007730 [Monosporascus sp. mg162]